MLLSFRHHRPFYNGSSFTTGNRINSTTVNSATYTYDLAGNVINDGTNHYVYDPEGRLCGLWQSGGQFTQYIYDAGGNRVAKGTVSPSTNWPTAGNTCNAPTAANGFTLTAQYLRGQSGDQDIEFTGAGQLAHQNIFEGGGLTATYWNYNSTAVPEYELSYNFSDWLGTKRLQTNNNPSPETYWRSDPFGNYLTPYGTEADATGTTAPIHFTGKERDTESGNDYFLARYYGSSMGRFLSPDDGYPDGNDASNPQSWNLFGYVQNNPLTKTDPDGHDCIDTSNFSRNGTVTITTGDSCAKNLGPNGTYVNGTIDPNSITANVQASGTSFGYNFTSYDGQTGGAGVIAQAAPYGPLEGPDNQAGLNILRTASGTVGPIAGTEMAVIAAIMPGMFAADAAPLALAIQRPLTEAAKTAVRGVLKQIQNGTTKGKPFLNLDGKLPSKPEGYYREYTAPLTGETSRGASRVVTGAGGEVYYTPNHYYSFTQVK